jgi:hypothetical protein
MNIKLNGEIKNLNLSKLDELIQLYLNGKEARGLLLP